MTDLAIRLARLAQFIGACGLLGGAAFLVYGAPPGWRAPRAYRLILAALAGLGALGAAGWIAAQAVSLGDLQGVLDADFGRAALVRLVALIVGVIVALMAEGPRRAIALAILGGVACLSFAWTGHGAADEGWRGALHLAADALHAVAAGVWLGALWPLVLMVCAPPKPDAARTVAFGLARFSAIGPAVVLVLVVTGAINTLMLVPPDQVGAALGDGWGRLLAVKLALFAAMLGFAAIHRWRLTPALERGQPVTAMKALRSSLAAETALGLLVLGLVAWLGTQPPLPD